MACDSTDRKRGSPRGPIEHAFFTNSTDPLWWRRALADFDPAPAR
jgi:hypothetical protein